MGAATHGTFEVHSVAELPHLSCTIHNKFLDSFDYPPLLTAEQSLVGRKPQPTVVSRLIQGSSDAPHRFDFDHFPRLQAEAFRGRGFICSFPIGPKKRSPDSPEKPYRDALCHLKSATIAAANFIYALPKSLAMRQLVSGFE
jgi:hypothetical protein